MKSINPLGNNSCVSNSDTTRLQWIILYLVTQRQWVLKNKKTKKDMNVGWLVSSFGLKHLLPSLTTWIGSLGPTWWKERTDSCKLPSDSHICAIPYTRVTPQITVNNKMLNTNKQFNYKKDMNTKSGLVRWRGSQGRKGLLCVCVDTHTHVHTLHPS